jgi:predicted nucleotidyltransferase
MSVANPFGLPPSTLGKLNSVFARHNAIGAVLIYGSRAKGNYRAGSDIDLTIKGCEISFAEMMQIEDQIDDLMLPYSVDLSQYLRLSNHDLLEHIDRVGVEIYVGKKTNGEPIPSSNSDGIRQEEFSFSQPLAVQNPQA